jgi:hypothetical protein
MVPDNCWMAARALLLLTRIQDRLRAELIQDPAHAAELGCGHHESDLLTRKFSFDPELAPRLYVIVQNEIAHDPGTEVGRRGEFQTAIVQLFPANHLAPPFLIRRGTRPKMGERTASLWHREILVRIVVVRSHPN